MTTEFVLTLRCPDQPGILARITTELFRLGGDLRNTQSYADESSGEFFVRIHLTVPAGESADTFRNIIAEVSVDLGAHWQLRDCAARQNVLIMVSKFDHCLVDLLHRSKIGALAADIRLVISNHEDVRSLVEWHNIPFLHLPVTKETKSRQESELLRHVEEQEIDLVILARYMQILSNDLCRALSGRCINIHHSFLPSFKGAMPYKQAHDRGVKLIGATAHYVTADLDEGPIIEQDVRRFTHAATVEEMTATGRETESSVLARAVRWHLEHRIILNGSKTVIFN